MPRPVLALLLAIAAPVALAACGGGGGSEAPSTPPGLAKPVLVRRADAICAQAIARTRRASPGPALNLVGIIAALEASAANARPALDRLSRLRPRPDDRHGYEEYLVAERQLLAGALAVQGATRHGTAGQIRAALLRTEHATAPAVAAARAFGLHDCQKGPDTRIGGGGSASAASPPTTGRTLHRAELRVDLPTGWRPFRITHGGPHEEAYGDDHSSCLFGFNAEKAEGRDTPSGALAYARRQARSAARTTPGYRLVSVQVEHASSAVDGGGIVRIGREEGTRKAVHVAFFFENGRRYLVDCISDEADRAAEIDARYWRPIIRSLSIPGKPG